MLIEIFFVQTSSKVRECMSIMHVVKKFGPWIEIMSYWTPSLYLSHIDQFLCLVQYLEENAELILAILEGQNQGKFAEIAQLVANYFFIVFYLLMFVSRYYQVISVALSFFCHGPLKLFSLYFFILLHTIYWI